MVFNRPDDRTGRVPKKAAAFTVAICTRNRANFLHDCLNGLIASMRDIDAPIFVIDNGSEDESARIARSFAPRIELFYESQVGLSHARNAALERCATDYLVFLDDDAVPDLSWAPAVAEITSSGDADVFGGPYRPFYTTPKADWFNDSLGSAHMDMSDGPQLAPACFSGGNMGWRTNILLEMGGFDPALGLMGDRMRLGEETALQLAIRKNYPRARFEFISAMSMMHHVSKDKMSLRYIYRRNYIYGQQLRDIDPANPLNYLGLLEFCRRTRLGLPLILRLFYRNRDQYPYWRSYAAQYLSLNAILLGSQLRKWRELDLDEADQGTGISSGRQA